MAVYTPIWQETAGGHTFDLVCLLDQASELVIEISDSSDQRLSIVFEWFLAYRRIDEGDAILILSEMGRAGVLGNTFFKVDDSKFLAWFRVQSCGTYDDGLCSTSCFPP